ncbi:MAG: hypothetical protein HYR97_08340 [Candidatus Melainabacteria bacterium]|nr:hypothetical protein [Candidatus Melainabacteria bacterium]MBI3308769.1 hypothetical protein [Candidatus Melainabacteria bacterium]
MKEKKTLISVVFALLLIAFVVAYAYSQFVEKSIISAVLQYQVNLDSPPNAIFAILTQEQKLPMGQKLQKGTRLIGMIDMKENKGFEINFTAIQKVDGDQESFSGKAIFETDDLGDVAGISSNLSKTFHQKTKSSVLGAIFTTNKNVKENIGSILPRGTTLKIEVE